MWMKPSRFREFLPISRKLITRKKKLGQPQKFIPAKYENFSKLRKTTQKRVNRVKNECHLPKFIPAKKRLLWPFAKVNSLNFANSPTRESFFHITFFL